MLSLNAKEKQRRHKEKLKILLLGPPSICDNVSECWLDVRTSWLQMLIVSHETDSVRSFSGTRHDDRNENPWKLPECKTTIKIAMNYFGVCKTITATIVTTDLWQCPSFLNGNNGNWPQLLILFCLRNILRSCKSLCVCVKGGLNKQRLDLIVGRLKTCISQSHD